MKKNCEVEKTFWKAGSLVHSKHRNGVTSQSILSFLFLSFFFSSIAFSSEIISGKASYYGLECCRYNPHRACPTASGRSLRELVKEKIPYAASWLFPMGTRLKVTNKTNGKSTEVVILDRGPAKRLHRVIDLSEDSFKKIADKKLGLISVRIEVIK